MKFYQSLSTDMQSYFSNSADIQRTGPVRKKDNSFITKKSFLKGLLPKATFPSRTQSQIQIHIFHIEL